MRLYPRLLVIAALAAACGDDGVLNTTSGALQVEPPSLDFGRVPEGTMATRNLVVTNPGAIGIVVNLAFSPESSGEFSADLAPFGLAPRSIATVEVTYAPVGPGDDTGTLVLTPDDPRIEPASVQLSSGKIAPRLDVTPNPVEFAPARSSTVTRTVTMINRGDAHLRIDDVRVDEAANPDFSLSTMTLPATLVAGASTAVQITYVPSHRGENGALVIDSNDESNPQSRVQLVPDRLSQCEDGIDNDGDGWVDFGEDFGCDSAMDDDESDTPECTHTATEACGSDVGACQAGVRECVRGRWMECVGQVGPSVEICNGVDDDCNMRTDEAISETCTVNGCAGARLCVEGSSVAGGQWTACVPVMVSMETCDGVDNNCDGVVDEGILQPCTINGCMGTRMCVVNSTGTWTRCQATNPMPEVCNGVDDDCNGPIDDGLGTLTCGIGACMNSVAACSNATMGMCVPGTPGVEVCNGADDDCDMMIDEDLVTLTAPALGSMTADRTPTFTWTTRPGETYTLSVSTSTTFATQAPGFPVANAMSPYTPPTPLADGVTYYWRVQGQTTGGCAFASNVQSFDITPCGFTFNLQLPAAAAALSDPTPDLAWDFTATNVCTLNLTDDAGVAVAGYPLSAATPPHTVTSPLADGTYRWSVDCTDTFGCMASAPAAAPGYRTFSVSTQCAAPTPTLEGPAMASRWLGMPLLRWQSAGAGLTYRVSIDTDPAFSSPTVRQTSQPELHASEFGLPLTPGTTYYWRVAANNGQCTGADSPWRSFTMAMTYSAAACSGPRESPTLALMGGGLLGSSYASQLTLVSSGPLAGKIFVAVSDSDGFSSFGSTVRCFERSTMMPCTAPGATIGSQLTSGMNTNVPGVAVSPTGDIYVTASDFLLNRRIYVFNSTGVLQRTINQATLARGIAYDETSAPPQLLVNDNGAAVMRSIGTNGQANWTAGTSAISNVDLEIDAANGRILQTVLGGVDVLAYAAPGGPAPARAFTLRGTGAFQQMDPTGVTGLIGPMGNRTFIAVSDFADPSALVFYHLGTDPQGRDSFPTLRLTDSTAPLRYVVGLDEDPATGDIFVATHPAGQALRHTSFRVLRYCPRI